MGDHPTIDADRMFMVDQQTVAVKDTFRDQDLILDLGGGGEGIIGQLRGRQVVAVDIRQDELEDCAPGPIKVVADAKDLPFLDASFDAATAFFFLMYVAAEERPAVLAEAFRALRPGGILHIWDATIPDQADHSQELFVVPIKAELPSKTIGTGYGVPWKGREMTADSITHMAIEAGFTLVDATAEGETFQVVLARPA